MAETRSLKIVVDLAGNAKEGLNGILSSFSGITAATGGVYLAKQGIDALTTTIEGGVSKALSLEEQMSTIGARSGASAVEIAKLKDLVSNLGLDPTLKVSAFEAAQAVEELAAGGVPLKDIMDGAAQGVVALANATGADFAQAAEISASAMSIFGIGSKNIKDVVDGATATVVASKFDINDYALALAQAGGVAKTSGVGFDDFNTAITAIAPLFASGSDAGTSFKTFLQNLVPKSKGAKAAMSELGLEFFDSNGKMKDIANIAGQLNSVFNGTFTVTKQVGGVTKEMTQEAGKAQQQIPGLTTKISEQQTKLDILKQELTGVIAKYGEGSSQAQNKSLAITKLSNDIAENNAKLAEYQAAIDAANNTTTQTITETRTLSEEQRNAALSTIFGTDAMRAAAGLANFSAEQFRALQEQMGQTNGADAAAMRMDNLAGDTEILRGVIESLQISYGEKLIPRLRDFAQFATDYLSNNGPQFVEWFADLSIKVLSLAQEIIPKIVEQFNRFSGDMSQTVGPAMLLIEDALTRIAKAFGVNTEKVSGQDVILKILKATLDAIVIAVKLVAVVMQGVAWAVEKVSQAVAIGKGLWNQLRDIVTLGAGQMKERINGIYNSTEGLRNIFSEAMNGIKRAIGGAVDKWNDFKNAVRNAVNVIPNWLIPHSPTPFEVGLRGIAAGAGQVAGALPQAFKVAGGGPALAGAGAGGGTPIVVNLTYAPAISMADRMEVERILMPTIFEGIRKAKANGTL